MSMRFEMSPEQSLQVAVELAQKEISELQDQQKELRELIVGGTDPRKGLLWLCMNQGELLTSLGKLVTAQADALAAHKETPHPIAIIPQSLGEKLRYEALRQIVVVVIAGILILLLAGTLSFIRTGKAF